jgi:hypothetical protein
LLGGVRLDWLQSLWSASFAREEEEVVVEDEVHVDEEEVAVVEVVSLRDIGSRGKDSIPW